MSGSAFVLVELREAPIIVTESASGSDAPNRLLRLRLAEKKGWWVQDLSLSSIQSWPEGDYMTQRRLDILVGAVGTIDPTVDNPSHLPALYKLDDPERFTKEILATDADGNTISSYDPFPFEMETADIPLGDVLTSSVLRGYTIRYERPSVPFTVETKIDGDVVQSDSIPPSSPGMTRDYFVGIARIDNVGAKARWRVFDETEYDLKISMIQPMWIPKGTRARG